ncbi:MAG: cation:proton antiporter [Methanobacteriaceae archaeon]
MIILTLGIVIILGVILTKLLDNFRLPGFIGFLALGILMGPFALNIMDSAFLGLSQEISTFAIVILLIRAGLSLSRDSLRKVGRPSIEMGFVPSVIEGGSIIVIAPFLLGISPVEAGMLGFILAAVSPAILVPQMLSYIERGIGTIKSIPTLIMAGSSTDDVVAITIFSSFLGIYLGGKIDILWEILGIPISLILGLILGLITAIILLAVFRKWEFTDTEKLFITLSTAIILNSIGTALEDIIPVAGLLGVMVIGFVILDRSPKIANVLSQKFSKLWILAEIVVFVMLGAQLNIVLALNMLGIGLLVISLGLVFRSIGVYIALFGTDLTFNEKVFCMLAYTPKATVQATIGAVPLAMGVASGEIILAITAIAILFTAPLGAISLKLFGERLLTADTPIDTSLANSIAARIALENEE